MYMDIESIIKEFKNKPYMLRMGAGKLSKRLKCSPSEIKQARNIYRNGLDRKVSIPKILLLDVETSPMQAYVFNLWKQNIAWDHTKGHWFILCWSAKWLYDDNVMHDRLTGEEAINEDDSRIVKSIWSLLDEADVVITHNALGADIPWLNTRFVMNGLIPPKPYQVVDTLQVCRKKFGFASNKLDALCEYFHIPHKDPTDFELWRRCCNGDEEALEYMQHYNINDTKILESVYLVLLPWIPNSPNIANMTDRDVCPHCGSEDIEEIKDKFYYTGLSKYKLYRCKNCGTVLRGRENLNRVEGRRVPYVSINR